MRELCNLGFLTERAAAATPSAIAVIEFFGTQRAFDYAHLHQAMSRFAATLQSKGIRPGDRVAIAMSNRYEFIVALFGAMRAGAIAVPISPDFGHAAATAIIADAAVRALVLDQAFADLEAPSAEWSLDVDSSSWAEWTAKAPPFAEPALPRDHPAMIVYTSGSVGAPKGVVLTHEGQLWPRRAAFDREMAGLTSKPGRALIATPLGHKNALMVGVKSMLFSGGTVIVLPRFSAQGVVSALREQRCTYASLLPSMYGRVLEHLDRTGDHGAFPSVQALFVASAPAPTALFERLGSRFGVPILNGYGLTESGPAFGQEGGEEVPLGSIGKPLAGVDVRLTAPDGKPRTERGELWLRSRSMASGYWNRPEETSRRFVDGWLRTGDILRRDGDGWYYFEGRTDDWFKHRGHLVCTGEIESVLTASPTVRAACVLAVEDDGDQVPVAFVEGDPSCVTSATLHAFCAARLPRFAAPVRFHVLERLPVLGSGKWDRQSLRTIDARRVRQTGT